jgi:molybdopterin converting factor small subunit
MRVRTRLLGSLKQPAAPKEEYYEMQEGTTVSALMNCIIATYPNLEGILDSLGNLVMIDGVEIANLDGSDTYLSEGSEVVFVPVTHGG